MYVVEMDYIGENTSETTEKGLGKPFHQIVIGFVLLFPPMCQICKLGH